MSDYRDLVQDVWSRALEQTVREVIADNIGSALDTDIHQAIKDQARKMIETSPELQGMIFDALKSWISTQTADDVRKNREDNIRRFGGAR